MNSIREPERQTPVIKSADVVVIGGGTGGLVAAIAAARSGAKTLLIEQYGYLGGMATAALMNSFNGFRNEVEPNHVQTVKGIAQEIVDRLIDINAASGYTAHTQTKELKKGESPYAVGFDPEALKIVALEMCLDAGVEILFHTLFCDVSVSGREVEAAVIESKSGRGAVAGKVFVDATGDGDLAAKAGARFEKADKEKGNMMKVTLMYRVSGIPEPQSDERRLYVNGITTQWGPWFGEIDGSDVEDLSQAEIRAHREIRKHFEGIKAKFPNAELLDSAAVIGVRETRRIIGEYTITEEDALSGRPFDDSIAVCSNPVPTYYGERRFLAHLGFHIPYRSLVPADLDNVILAGRCISASQPAFQAARSMAPLMAVSQASGTAAAMCAQRNFSPAKLEISRLQQKLESDGCVIKVPAA